MEEKCPLCQTSIFVEYCDSHSVCTQCGEVIEESSITNSLQMNYNLNHTKTPLPELNYQSA